MGVPHNLNARSGSHYAVKSLAALYCGRGGRESAEFQNASATGQRTRQILSHRTADLLVVRSYVCGVFVGACLSVEYYHGYSFFVCAVDGRRDGHLTRSHDEQVNAFIHKAVDLFGL